MAGVLIMVLIIALQVVIDTVVAAWYSHFLIDELAVASEGEPQYDSLETGDGKPSS